MIFIFVVFGFCIVFVILIFLNIILVFPPGYIHLHIPLLQSSNYYIWIPLCSWIQRCDFVMSGHFLNVFNYWLRNWNFDNLNYFNNSVTMYIKYLMSIHLVFYPMILCKSRQLFVKYLNLSDCCHYFLGRILQMELFNVYYSQKVVDNKPPFTGKKINYLTTSKSKYLITTLRIFLKWSLLYCAWYIYLTILLFSSISGTCSPGLS